MAENFSAVNPWKGYEDKLIYKGNHEGSKTYKSEMVKIDADNTHIGKSLSVEGFISVDVRTILRVIQGNPESSGLNYFLKYTRVTLTL